VSVISETTVSKSLLRIIQKMPFKRICLLGTRAEMCHFDNYGVTPKVATRRSRAWHREGGEKKNFLNVKVNAAKFKETC
jgi:hypothetical protein